MFIANLICSHCFFNETEPFMEDSSKLLLKWFGHVSL